MSIKENLLSISKNLNKQATLIAVSKTFTTSLIKEAYAEGVRDFGENYLEEALEKVNFFKESEVFSDISWHYLGRVQSKKLNKMVGVFDYIHTLASMDHLKKIERLCTEKMVKQNVLIQVKHTEDERDYGINFSDLEAFIKECSSFKSINYCGLMFLPPQGLSIKNLELSFNEVFQVFNKIKEDMKTNGNNWNMISMGMSEDYKLALNEGSTHVRIGRGVFGERSLKK